MAAAQSYIDPTKLNTFGGLNNVADPMRAGWEFQSVADNVNGTDSNGMELREGYQAFLSTTNVTGSYSTTDYSRMFIVDNGSLKRVHADGTALTLYSGLSGTPHWTEMNDVVYLSCGTAKLQIELDNEVREWGVPIPADPAVTATTGNLFGGLYQVCLTYTDSHGREGGPSVPIEITLLDASGITVSSIPQVAGYISNLYVTDMDGTVFYRADMPTGVTAHTLTWPASGRELTLGGVDPPPVNGEYLAVFRSSIYMSEYMPAADQTIVWFSLPLGYHLFNMSADYFLVPGEVTQLHGSETALVVTTQTRVYLYDGAKLAQAAEYGTVSGQHADLGADGRIYFWTKRGLCRAAPFENLTEARISIAPGGQAGGTILERNGYRKYVAVVQSGGDAYNSR